MALATGCLGSSFAAFVALFSVLAVYLYRRPWLSGVLWGLAFASKINSFLGRLLLGDRGSAVSVFVGLSLAFVAAHGVEADGVFPTSNARLVSYYSRKTPLRGGRRCFSGRRGMHTTRSSSKRG